MTAVGLEIEFTSMKQLAEAVDEEDDWTGLTDPAARRKRQNRLNVRAYRRRRAQASQTPHSPSSPHDKITPENQRLIACWNEDQQRVVTVPAWLAKSISGRKKPVLSPERDRATHSVQGAGIMFPLSSDHLITLIQYNVLRACLTNLSILSLLNNIPVDESCSGMLVIRPDSKLDSTTGKPIIPPLLQPTHLQSTVEHPIWIDIIPHPVWRDNLIRAVGSFDEDELCSDVIGGLWDGYPDSDCAERGIIAWSPPWHVSGWEVSEGFWRKWGWTLRGCGEVLEAANRWRRLRGEDALVVEI